MPDGLTDGRIIRPVLLPAYPNPVAFGAGSAAGRGVGEGVARGTAVLIRFALPHAQDATLRLYDPSGRLIRTLLQGRLGSGVHETAWDGRDAAGRAVAAGSYYYRLSTGDAALTGRLAVVR
jgi:hypothetical protein